MMQKIEFSAMGSHMSAFLDNDQREAAEILTTVPACFETWEQSLSRFRADSELTLLNNSAGSGAFFQASQTLWAVLQEALLAVQESDGLVSPAILNELENAGYDRDFDQLIDLSQESGYEAFSDSSPLDAIELDHDAYAVRLPAGLRLDFGGIAKGWAADQAAQKLTAFGPALVNAGGDIAITAPPLSEDFWPVGVDNPHIPGSSLATLKISTGGIATSGKDHRRWQKNGIWQHHIIDPRLGFPAETDMMSATIIAPNVVSAEIAAKVVMILGSESGLAWLAQQPQLLGLMVLENGQRITSPGFSKYLWS